MFMLAIFIALILLSFATFFMGTRAGVFAKSSAALILILTVVYAFLNFSGAGTGGFTSESTYAFASGIGIYFSIGVDGLTVSLLILSTVISLIALLIANRKEYTASFYGLMLLTETGLFGILLSRDFLFFYIFWEIVLVPMYFIIGRFGGERKDTVSLKFFVYTHIGSVFILLSILTLFSYYYSYSGVFTLQMSTLLNSAFINNSGYLPLFWKDFMLFGFLLGFLVKLPSFPLHSWLPDSYTTAPYPATVMLAGGLSLMGGYGLFGILLPIYSTINSAVLWALIALGIISLLYFAFTAMFQMNMKRMMAYASASAMGFVTISFAAGILDSTLSIRSIELSGGIFQIVAHGIIMALIFSVLYFITENTGKENIYQMGGVQREMPWLSSFLLAGFLASLGLPGLAGFIGEFSIVVGMFQTVGWLIFFVILAMIVTASYHIWTAQRTLYGAYNENLGKIKDASRSEIAILASVTLVIFVLGVYPNLIFGIISAYVGGII